MLQKLNSLISWGVMGWELLYKGVKQVHLDIRHFNWNQRIRKCQLHKELQEEARWEERARPSAEKELGWSGNRKAASGPMPK